MTYNLIILTPDERSAEAINSAYRRDLAHDPSRKVRAYPVSSSLGAGARAEKVVIMPCPEHLPYQEVYKEAAKRAAVTITRGGQVIQL